MSKLSAMDAREFTTYLLNRMVIPRHEPGHVDVEAELMKRLSPAPDPAQGTPEPPKVEELAWKVVQYFRDLHSVTYDQMQADIAGILRPYFPPASQTPQSLDFHTWLTRVHGFKVGAARNSYSVADLESAWNAGISHRPEVIGASPLCLDCHSAGIRNCSHFDNCSGKWVYVATPVSLFELRNRDEAIVSEKEFLELARNYIWHDYANAASEFEEVEALVELLKTVHSNGYKAAREDALKVMREEGIGPFVMRHISRKLKSETRPS